MENYGAGQRMRGTMPPPPPRSGAWPLTASHSSRAAMWSDVTLASGPRLRGTKGHEHSTIERVVGDMCAGILNLNSY